MNINKDDLKKIIPGFSMGIVRAIISHPFEMMKLKSQINYKMQNLTSLKYLIAIQIKVF